MKKYKLTVTVFTDEPDPTLLEEMTDEEYVLDALKYTISGDTEFTFTKEEIEPEYKYDFHHGEISVNWYTAEIIYNNGNTVKTQDEVKKILKLGGFPHEEVKEVNPENGLWMIKIKTNHEEILHNLGFFYWEADEDDCMVGLIKIDLPKEDKEEEA